MFQQWRFPQADTPEAVDQLLTVDPLVSSHTPPWQEHHINTLLQELYRLGKQHFGNANFTSRVLDALQDMSADDRQKFMSWLNKSPTGQSWS